MSSPEKKKSKTASAASAAAAAAGDGSGSGWVPLTGLSGNQLEKEIDKTLASMLPFRAPALNPRRVLVDTTAGLREGHASQDHVVRDFDSRFKKTSTGLPLFTTGVFIKPPTLPVDTEDPAREAREKAEYEEELRKRALQPGVEAAAEGESGTAHLASELAQFTWNKFEMSRKASSDKTSEYESLKNVDPSRIQQLMSHNIRSSAPDRLGEPRCAHVRSLVSNCRKIPVKDEADPVAILPSSPQLHYFSIPGRADPIAPFSLLLDPFESRELIPQDHIELAKGNVGEEDTEAPILIEYSPPETHLHIPGQEQSYFSVPATPPSLSLAAPRAVKLEAIERASRKEAEARPRPVAPSTPPEPAFFVPLREVPALPRTHAPKTAGFGNFAATPHQEQSLQPRVARAKNPEDRQGAPPMLLPRTPAEETIDAPPGSELAKRIGNDHSAKRPDMFSIPPLPLAPVVKHAEDEKHQGVSAGKRPAPVLPKTPAEPSIAMPQRDSTGVQLPPSGQFFSVPATPPELVIAGESAPVIVRSKRKQDQEEAELAQDARKRADLARALASGNSDVGDEQQQEEGEGGSQGMSEAQLLEAFRIEAELSRKPKTVDFAATSSPKRPLPFSPPEDHLALPVGSKNRTGTLDVHTVFAIPGTPVSKPIQPDIDELHKSNPSAKPGADPVLPRTPTELTFVGPLKKNLSAGDLNLQDATFSIPPTPPEPPLLMVPGAKKKEKPGHSDPASNAVRLPPTPVDSRLEALPPVNDSEMHSSQKRERAQVFSMTATPLDQDLSPAEKVEHKPKREVLNLPKPLMPKSPTESHFALPPSSGVSSRSIFAKAEISSSSTASSSLQSTPHSANLANRSVSFASSSSSSAVGGKLKAQTGEFFSLPATPPTSNLLSKPSSITIKRKQGQSEKEKDVMNTRPVIPSTPPEESFILPNNNNNQNNNKQNQQQTQQQQQQQGKQGQFFSLAATPPGASEALEPQQPHRVGARDPGLPSVPKVPTPQDLSFDVPQEARIPATVAQKPGYVAKQHPGFGDRTVPVTEAQRKALDAQHLREREMFDHVMVATKTETVKEALDGFENLEYSRRHDIKELVRSGVNVFGFGVKTTNSPPKRESEEERLQRQLKELEAREQELREVEKNRQLTESEAARKIQCLERKRKAKKELERLKKERAEKEQLEKKEKARALELERHLKELESQQKQLDAQASNRDLTPEEAARRIQCKQRQRKAKKELEELKQKKVLEEKRQQEEEAAFKAAALQNQLKELEAQQKALSATEKTRQLTPEEAAKKIQCLQRQRMARRELSKLKGEKSIRQKSEGQAAAQRAQVSQEKVERLQSELSEVNNTLEQLEIAGKSRALTKEETETREKLLESKGGIEQEIERLESQVKIAQQEQQAFESAANASSVSERLTRKRDESKALDEQIANIKSKAALENNRPLLPSEVATIEQLDKHQQTLKKDVAELESQASSAKNEAQRQRAEVESSKADDKVDELEDQVKALEDEARRIEQRAKEEKRELTPEEAARKIQCRQRQNMAKKDLERRRKEAGEKSERKAIFARVGSLSQELQKLQKQEVKFAEIESKQGFPLNEDWQDQREIGLKRMEEIKEELTVLKTRKMEIDPSLSSPASALDLLPSPQPSPRGAGGETPRGAARFSIEKALQDSASGSTSSATATACSTDQQTPLPPLPRTPPELSIANTIPFASSGPNAVSFSPSASSSSSSSATAAASGGVVASRPSMGSVTPGSPSSVPFATSLPADIPALPLRILSDHHHQQKKSYQVASDSGPTGLIAPLPPTPSELDLSPSTQPPPVQDISVAVNMPTPPEQSLLGDSTGEERFRQLQEEQRKMAELARTEDEAATRIQNLQRQRAAKRELERRRAQSKKEQEEAEAIAAAQDVVETRQKLERLRKEQEAVAEKAKSEGRALTESEVAIQRQNLEKQRAAEKELDVRKAKAKKERDEAELAQKVYEKVQREMEEARQRDREEFEQQKRQLEEQRQRDREEFEKRQKELEEAGSAKAQEADLLRLAMITQGLDRAEQKQRGRVLSDHDDAFMKITSSFTAECIELASPRRLQILVDEQRKKELKEQEEARQAEWEAAAAAEKVRQLEEEQKKLEATARNEQRPLTEEESAVRIQNLQRQRMAKKELERRRLAVQKEQAEAEAAKALREEAEAQQNMKKLEKEQKEIEEKAKSEGRALTEDEAARRIQNLQRQRLAKKELERKKQSRAAKQEEMEARQIAVALNEYEDELAKLQEQDAALEQRVMAEGRGFTQEEASMRMQNMERQRVVRKEIQRHREVSKKEEAESEAAQAKLEAGDAKRHLDTLSAQQEALQEKAKREGLTEHEAALQRQNIEKQRIAEQELQIRRQEALRKEQAAQQAARELQVAESARLLQQQQEERQKQQQQASATAAAGGGGGGGVVDHGPATAEANRLAADTVRQAQIEAQRRLQYESGSAGIAAHLLPNQQPHYQYQPTATSSRISTSSSTADDRQSLPGIGNNANNAPSSVASSNLLTDPGNRTPEYNSNFGIRQPGGAGAGAGGRGTGNRPASAVLPPTSPIIIRRGGGGGGGTTTPGSQSHHSSHSHQHQHHQHSSSSHVAVTPTHPGHVLRTVADSMPQATSLPEFASQLEVYFATFDPSQISAIQSIAPAYRNRQRDLWNFLKGRYETKDKQQQPTSTSSSVVISPQQQQQQHKTSTTTASSSGVPAATTSSVVLTPAMQAALRSPGSPSLRSAAHHAATSALEQNQSQHQNQQQHQQQQTLGTPNASVIGMMGSPSASPSPIIIRRGSGSGGTTVSASRTWTAPNTTSGSAASGGATTTTIHTGATTTTTPQRQQQQQQNQTAPSTSTVFTSPVQDLDRSDEKPTSLVEDLALSEILRMLNKEKR